MPTQSEALALAREGDGGINPGALEPVILMAAEPDADALFAQVRQMKLTGSALYYAYNDFAHQRPAVFLSALRERDPAMIETVNRALRIYDHVTDPARLVSDGRAAGDVQSAPTEGRTGIGE